MAGYIPKRLGASLALKSRIKKAVARGEVGLIHAHGLWMLPTIYSGLYKRKGTYKFVLSPHGALSPSALSYNKWSKYVFSLLFQRSTLKNVDYFHATTMSELRCIRNLGYNQPVIVIPPGVEIPELKNGKELDRRVLVFLSRLHPGKGLEDLLISWSSLEKDFEDWELRIYGSGDFRYESKLKSLLISLGIKRASFEGPVYGHDKDFVLQNASLFVLPSYSENFGIAVAESLANATPVVVCKGAPWDDLESKGCGWWINNGSKSLTIGLSMAMRKSKDELTRMGLKGRDWMVDEYSWGAIAFKFERSYDWICNLSDRPVWVVN